MARTLNRLTDRKVRTAGKGMYADGGGLWLQVTTASGGHMNRGWFFRFATGETVTSAAGKQRNRERLMGLGSLDTVTLAEARQRASECRKMREQGIDPIEARDAQRAAKAVAASRSMTFDQCRDAYIAAHRAGWRNVKHAGQWTATLEKYASPVFGKLPVSAVDQTLVLKVLEPIWYTKSETASRVRGRIESVLDWAKAKHYRDGENPARWKGHLDMLLPARAKVREVKHHAALPYADIPAFMADLRSRDSISAAALELLILCANRTTETIGARRHEIDTAAKLWTIPSNRMKARKEHRIPLSSRALAIINQTNIDDSEFLFPGAIERKPLSNMAMAELLKGMGRGKITVHGFRSTFRDWAAECTDFPNHVIEMALAHTIGNRTEAAYRRGDLLEKRRELMEAWAGYCNEAASVRRGVAA